MEFTEVLKKRHSIRHFKDADVTDEQIRELVKAAGMAPSGKNCQNWHFVVIKNRSLLEKIADCISEKNEEISKAMDQKEAGKGDTFRKFLKNFTLLFLKAPALIVVYTTEYYPTGYHELKGIEADDTILKELLYRKNPGMQNLGAALENLTLSAVDQGLGTCWLTSANYAANEIQTLLEKEIGFKKEGYFMGALMALGVPEENPKSPAKKTVEEIYTLIK